MLRLEEPSVTQSTLESENLGEMVSNKWKAVRLSDKEEAEVNIAVLENDQDTKV